MGTSGYVSLIAASGSDKPTSQSGLNRLNKNLWDMGLFFIWYGRIIEDFGWHLEKYLWKISVRLIGKIVRVEIGNWFRVIYNKLNQRIWGWSWVKSRVIKKREWLRYSMHRETLSSLFRVVFTCDYLLSYIDKFILIIVSL